MAANSARNSFGTSYAIGYFAGPLGEFGPEASNDTIVVGLSEFG